MVKAGSMGSTRVGEAGHSPTSSSTTTSTSAPTSPTLLLQFVGKCKQEVNVDSLAKRISLKRFFSFGKGRRKEKEAGVVPPTEPPLYLDDEYVNKRILDCALDAYVSLPQGLDYNEWLATHTFAFFEHVNLLYGAVSHFCTSSDCTSMTGPNNLQYQWVDEKGKKCKCAAPQYVEYAMTYTQKTIHDETIFPTKYGNVFPPSFEQTVKKIQRLLFHVLCHLYAAHYKEILLLHLHPHLNTLLHHFLTFSRQFNLLDEKESDVLDDVFGKVSAGAVAAALQRAQSHCSVDSLADNCNDNNSVEQSQPASDAGLPPPPPPPSLDTCLSIDDTSGNGTAFPPPPSPPLTDVPPILPPLITGDTAELKHSHTGSQDSHRGLGADHARKASEENKENLGALCDNGNHHCREVTMT